jgi:hypothetical protein
VRQALNCTPWLVPALSSQHTHTTTTTLLTRYGGLACRDLMAMARGLLEATDAAYQVRGLGAAARGSNTTTSLCWPSLSRLFFFFPA